MLLRKVILFFSILLQVFNAALWGEVDWQAMLDEPVIISLSRHLYRYTETYELMEEAGFTNIQRFEAVDGSCTSKKFFDKLNIKRGRRGQKGCAASHLLLWKMFLENSFEKEYLFVCEDDMLPHSDFFSLFPMYWNATPKDFDIVMVGNRFGKKIDLDVEDLIISVPTFSTHAYIISKKGAEKLLELYRKIPEERFRSGYSGYIIDVFLKKVMTEESIIYYCYHGKKFPDTINVDKIRKGPSSGICFQNKTLGSTIMPERPNL